MTSHNPRIPDELAPSRPAQERKWTTAWIISVLVAGLFLAGWWFWGAPTSARRNDVMTVEAISEGGRSLAGRKLLIVNARVTQVVDGRSFWIRGSRGETLLVVTAGGQDTAAAEAVRKLVVGERVSVKGELRDGASHEGSAAKDRAQVAAPAIYFIASEILKSS